MKKRSAIEEIDRLGLCLGCGLCESICGKHSVEMKLQDDGFIHPEVKTILPENERIIKKICPGINVVNDIDFNAESSVWGHISNLMSGYCTDRLVRQTGSSGGIVSGIAIYLLELGIVDAVMQVGGDANDYERNTLRISRSKEEVISCASSRYAPAHVFDNIIGILDSDTSNFLFVGKPCDISALKNFLKEYPQYSERFKLTVSIICAGMPSFSGTSAIIDDFKAAKPVKNLVYRGNGWPGFFSFEDAQGNQFQKSYNDSWGKTLNRHLKLRCKLCPDGIGIQADIAVGDAWETNNGYPDFTEKEGQSLIISRTKIGDDILSKAQQDGYFHCITIPQEKIKLMQPYQFNRRTKIGARLAAFYLAKGTNLNYKNLGIVDNLRKVKILPLIKEFVGTYKRMRR